MYALFQLDPQCFRSMFDFKTFEGLLQHSAQRAPRPCLMIFDQSGQPSLGGPGGGGTNLIIPNSAETTWTTPEMLGSPGIPLAVWKPLETLAVIEPPGIPQQCWLSITHPSDTLGHVILVSQDIEYKTSTLNPVFSFDQVSGFQTLTLRPMKIREIYIYIYQVTMARK